MASAKCNLSDDLGEDVYVLRSLIVGYALEHNSVQAGHAVSGSDSRRDEPHSAVVVRVPDRADCDGANLRFVYSGSAKVTSIGYRVSYLA
jgi:hypothetical protein